MKDPLLKLIAESYRDWEEIAIAHQDVMILVVKVFSTIWIVTIWL